MSIYSTTYYSTIHSRNLPGLDPLLYPARRPPVMGLGGLSSTSSGISYNDKEMVVSGDCRGVVVMMVVVVMVMMEVVIMMMIMVVVVVVD